MFVLYVLMVVLLYYAIASEFELIIFADFGYRLVLHCPRFCI